MIPEIEQHRNEIIAICKEFGLERLELFGSAATGDFDPERSDVDFLWSTQMGTISGHGAPAKPS